jgi:Flp pilus assembly protein protease CpaA
MTTVSVVAMVLLGVTVITAAWTDVRTGLIHNWLTYPAMLVGLLLWAVAGLTQDGWTGAWQGALDALIALLVGLIPFVIFAASYMIGPGDAKLVGAVGALCGDWSCLITAIFYTCVAALLIAIVTMVVKRITWKVLKRTFALLLSKAAGVDPPDAKDGPKLPFGLALMVGALLAGSEYLLGVQWPWTHLNTLH